MPAPLHRGRRGHAPASPGDLLYPDDAANIKAAAAAQAGTHGWVIIWLRWRQVYGAWECRDPAQVRVVEASSLPELGELMRLVDLELEAHSLIGHRGDAVADPQG